MSNDFQKHLVTPLITNFGLIQILAISENFVECFIRSVRKLILPSSAVPFSTSMTDYLNNGVDSLDSLNDKASSINSDCADSCLGLELEDDEGPPLDPRHLNLVHEELEKLNIATDVINKLEVQLDGARTCFREIQATWSEKLKELSKKYTSAITKARPYYEAKVQERRVREESQKSAIRFERATSLLAVAKQQVALSQDSLTREKIVSPECLEVLNHHIQRVNQAEEERATAEDEHRRIAARMMQLAEQIKKMEKENKNSIRKSKQYFDQRLEFTKVLERQKELILRLEAEVRQKKCDYTTSLRNLERISDSIHEQRSIGSSRSGQDIPQNPPPYQPTAPPPYEEGERYVIEQEKDEVLDPIMCMMSEEPAEWDRPRSLGSGVILLAQQLMGGAETKLEEPMVLAPSQTDVSYRTRPEGISTTPSDSSEVSSLASYRTSGIGMTDDEALNGMLRSHSTLIQEIETATDRLGHYLRRSISDAESGVESSSSRS